MAKGLSTTTFAYDNNGNVTQKTVDGTTTKTGPVGPRWHVCFRQLRT
jgi:hypothetical protein